MLASSTYKIILGGEGGVGKTTMLYRYVEGKFLEDTKMTIGVEIMNKSLKINDGRICDLQLWDFGGQERFRFFQDSFVLGASGAFLMFDLTTLFSFNKLRNWIEVVRKYDPTLPVVLLGGKCDLKNHSVKEEYILDFMKENNIDQYLNVSSKTGSNVEEAFQILVARIMEYKSLPRISPKIMDVV